MELIAEATITDQQKAQLAKEKEARPQAHRNPIIDIVRIFTAFSVITAHVHADTPAAATFTAFFSPIRTPFLYIAGLVFFINGLGKDKAINIKATMLRVWKRLGIPFVAWSIIYIALIIGKSALTGKNVDFSFVKVFAYGISAEHMYFLPELITMQIITLGVILLIRNDKSTYGLFLLLGAAVYLLWGRVHDYYGIQPVSAIAMYIIIAFYISPKIKVPHKTWGYFAVGLVLFFIAVCRPFLAPALLTKEHLIALPIGGIGMILLTLNTPAIKVPDWVLTITSTGYGVYLSHIMFLEGIEAVIEKMHYEVVYDITTKVIVSLLVFLMCIIFTLTVRRFTLARAVLLGEK